MVVLLHRSVNVTTDMSLKATTLMETQEARIMIGTGFPTG